MCKGDGLKIALKYHDSQPKLAEYKNSFLRPTLHVSLYLPSNWLAAISIDNTEDKSPTKNRVKYYAKCSAVAKIFLQEDSLSSCKILKMESLPAYKNNFTEQHWVPLDSTHDQSFFHGLAH